MRIRHVLSSGSARHEIDTSRTFFLRNPETYLALRPERNSRYDGWFWEDTRQTPSTFTKLLERIVYIKGEDVTPDPVGMTITEEAAFWEYGDGAKLGFQLTPDLPGLKIQTGRRSGLRIVLDIRNTYTQPQFGREYKVTRVAGGVVVCYTDASQNEPVYLHVASDDFIELKPRWEEAHYPWDAGRHSEPSTLYAYILGEVITENLSFGAGHTPEEAQQACNAARKLTLKMVGIGISYAEESLHNSVNVAKESTQRALEWLNTPHGVYAGLPWFHQIWSRDELIAALGFEPAARRDIIERYLTAELKQGELPTFIGSGTTCADGLGWLCLLLREHGLHDLSKMGNAATTTFLQKAYTGLQEQRTEDGFIVSGHNATWMDTIGREGCAIEIQCMYALVLELLGELTGDEALKDERTAFLAKIKAVYYQNEYLQDRLNDACKRPNVFLAYLLQPELLTEEEWKKCFNVVLLACNTPWGGLTSLDRTDGAFQAESTGEDNQSYHNGDSWFFINNLAAVALARCDSHIYQQSILRLLESSTKEILWENMLGQPGEIASADSGTSWGCGIQAFSAGAYLFMLTELGY